MIEMTIFLLDILIIRPIFIFTVFQVLGLPIL